MRKTMPILMLVTALAAACGAGEEEEFLARMAQEHRHDSPVTGAADRLETASGGGEVVYATLGDDEIAGYLALPTGGTATAGVILIHEWWGLNDNLRAMARKLADSGYTALAVDLYEGEAASDRDGARRLASRAHEQSDRVSDNLRQAVRYLRQELGVERLGVIGWCFGGSWSLRTALLAPEEIDAAVIYYGRLVTDRDELAALDSPLLGIFGALDGGIPVDTVRAFEAVLEDLGKEASIHVYDGADHAFANPSGSRYQPEAAEDAWAKTMAFFAEHLR